MGAGGGGRGERSIEEEKLLLPDQLKHNLMALDMGFS